VTYLPIYLQEVLLRIHMGCNTLSEMKGVYALTLFLLSFANGVSSKTHLLLDRKHCIIGVLAGKFHDNRYETVHDPVLATL